MNPKPEQRKKGLRVKSEELDASFGALRRFGRRRAAAEWTILELQYNPLRWSLRRRENVVRPEFPFGELISPLVSPMLGVER
jgi:hypothetical protein